MNEIKFYRIKDPYGEFSNFAPFPFSDGETIWPTAEHYFQAQKFLDETIQKKIRNQVSPMAAALEGRNRHNPLRSDWEAVKDDVMRYAVREKFRQHPELQELLLSTGNVEIIEHTRNDSYWGDGGDGSGQNKLGNILMELRKSLHGK